MIKFICLCMVWIFIEQIYQHKKIAAAGEYIQTLEERIDDLEANRG